MVKLDLWAITSSCVNRSLRAGGGEVELRLSIAIFLPESRENAKFFNIFV
jgi:hypothetical protein